MMRHSKTQTWLDGTSILSLPPRELVLEPVALEGSERAAYVWLEQLIVSEVARTNALLEAGTSARSSGGTLLVTGLRLLREASVAMHLLGGGGGVAEQLKPIEEIARQQLQVMGGPSAGGVSAMPDVEEVQLTRMTPSQALQRLGSLDRQATEAQHASSMYNARHLGDFERHSNQRQRVYERSRSYAMEDIDEKYRKAEEKREQLEQEAQFQRWLAVTRRWQWALERVTTGAVLCRAAQHDGADGSEAAGEEDAAAQAARPRPGGKFAWLWLLRAAQLHALKERLRAAEAALAEAEASVKAPALQRGPNGMYVNTSGVDLQVLASPVRLREAKTEKEQEFNREQLRGFVRRNAVVEVDGFNNDGAQFEREPAADDKDKEEGEGEGEDEGEGEGGGDGGDNCYVSVVADEDSGVPSGWVHNKQLVKGSLLARACASMDPPFEVEARRLRDDKKDDKDTRADKEKYRQQVFREAFRPLRAARDEARSLVRGAAAPAVYGFAALRRLADGSALEQLGGGATLQPVARLLAKELAKPLEERDALRTTAEVLAMARGALQAAAARQAGGGKARESAAEAKRAEAERALRTLREHIDERVGAVGPIGWRPTSRALEALRARYASGGAAAGGGWAWLRSSALQLRGLPAAATNADLEASLQRFVGGGLARAVVVRDGQPKGAALVDLGHEEGANAALREAAASGKGLPFAFPAEAEALQQAAAELEAEVQRLKEVKGRSADAKKVRPNPNPDPSTTTNTHTPPPPPPPKLTHNPTPTPTPTRCSTRRSGGWPS